MAGLLSTINKESATPLPDKPVRRRFVEFHSDVRPPSNRTVVICAIAGLLAAGSGVWVDVARAQGRMAVPAESKTAPTYPNSPDPQPVGSGGPTVMVNYAPAGFTRSQAGARAAAVALSEHIEQSVLYLSEAETDQMADQVAADDVREEMRRALSRDRATLRTRFPNAGAPGWWVVSALGVKPGPYTNDRAEVSVWMSYTAFKHWTVEPSVTHAITTLTLVWEDNDWKIAGSTVDTVTFLGAATRLTGTRDLTDVLDGFGPIGVDW